MIDNYGVLLRDRIKSLSLLFVLVLFTGSLVACNTSEQEALLFPEINPWNLKSLKISDKDNSVLLFTRKNCVWTFGKESLASNEALVTNLADQLVSIAYRKYITGNESMYANYLVDQDAFTYRVDIGLPEGQMKTMYLGSDSGSALTYARAANDENIYILSKAAITNIAMESDFWLPENDSQQAD